MNRALFLVLAASLTVGCKAAPAERAPRYGEVMTEVGRRFELIGKAARAQRWELAEYQLDELKESMASLEKAEPPRESQGKDLATPARAFLATQPASLAAGLKSRSAEPFLRAFREAAAACNQCHSQSGHKFIEVPEIPGMPVPRVTPLGPSEVTNSPPAPSETPQAK